MDLHARWSLWVKPVLYLLPVCRGGDLPGLLPPAPAAPAAASLQATKFVKIFSTDANNAYPDDRLPTVLVYHKGGIAQQYFGLDECAPLMGASTSAQLFPSQLAEPPGSYCSGQSPLNAPSSARVE